MVTIADIETCRGMQPEIQPGDRLTIERNVNIKENDIVLLLLNGEPKLSRIKFIQSGVWLMFTNPAYLAEFIPAVDKIRIIGKVTQRIRSF